MNVGCFRRIGIAALTALALTAAPARAEGIFECSIAQHPDNGNWIAPTMVVSHKGDEATIFDGIIKQFIGNPIAAKIETDNPVRTTFVWEVTTKGVTNQTARMQYRLTITKADLKASVAARPPRYSNNFTARGTCKPVKG